MSVEKKPQTISEPEPVAAPEPQASPPTPSTSEARVTTNDEWVKPSQVSPDRVRTADGTTKPKSEMEKAREAFAKADKVGIEEEGDGIIETRMLRASEVQELMGEMETQRQAVETQPSTPAPKVEPAQPPTRPPSVSTPPTGAPPTSTPPSTAPPGSTTPQVTPTSQPEPKPTPAPKTVMPEVALKASTPTPPPEKPVPKPAGSSIAEIEAVLSEIPDPVYRQDPQIIGIVNDLKNLHTELAQFNSDLETVRTRLESEVQDYWNVAEVKRIQFESLEEQLRLAKQEWNDSTKVYQQSEKRMKNEVSSREKRIKDIKKRIEKTEDQIGKRVKDLDREKEKAALSS